VATRKTELGKEGYGIAKYSSNAIFSELQTALLESLKENFDFSMIMIPNLMVATGNAIYIVKPMKRRFWLGRQGIIDADQIVLAIDRLANQEIMQL